MAFCELRYYSPALGRQTAANCIIPQQADRPLAVLYLLHGLSDDHTAWARNSSIERYVAGLPLLVVMPNGGRSFYCDAQVGERYESALLEDLMPFVERTFGTGTTRESRCIGGLSMGGYGAIKLALKHPQLFVSAHSHSGAMLFGHTDPANRPDHATEFERILGPHPAGGSNDCFALASKAVLLEPQARPALRFDCGMADELLGASRRLHDHLQTLGYEHSYEEFDGGHQWSYWDRHVQEAISFHAACCKIT